MKIINKALLLGMVAVNAVAETPAKTPASLAKSSNTTYIACYFNEANPTWKWGLNADDSWYKISGTWEKTPHTKIEKFFTTGVTQDGMRSACANAKRYYQVDGELFAFFAAESSMGSNYPIVLDNVELYPRY